MTSTTARLADADYAALRDYLAQTAGLVFDESRRAMLAVVVAERLRATGIASVAEYVAALDGPDGSEGPAERARLLDAATVQETHFFRNTPQMDALRQRVLPDLLRRAARRDRPLTVWSAGCSTGEEAYTLAIQLLELAASGAAGPAGAPPRIVATDISAEAVRAAGRATYRGRTLDGITPAMRARWFEERATGLAVREEVRRLVEVRLHNLVGDPPPFAPGEVDLVLCRNVTIYFSRATTREVIGGFHDVLDDGGYLLIGHSETLWQVSDAFTLVPMGETFVYRRSRAGSRSAVRRSATPEPRRAPRPVPRRRAPAPAPAPVAARPVRSRRPLAADVAADVAAARGALAAGDYAVAARLAGAAAEQQPLDPAAYVVLGHALSTLGEDIAALDALRKAVYLDPAAGHAHFLLAGALARLGQHGPAAAAYRAAARALPRVPQADRDAVLGERPVDDLVDLCQRLARTSDGLSGEEPAEPAGRRSGR